MLTPEQVAAGLIEHTPGPLKAIKGSIANDDMRCAVVAERGELAYLVATIENGAPGDCCDTEYANALLFAAAPKMREFMQAIHDLLDEEIQSRFPNAEGRDTEIYSLLSVPRNIAARALSFHPAMEQPQ